MTLVERLRAAGCVFAEDEAELLLASPDYSEELVQRRIDGEPLEYVLGWAAFGDARYVIEPGVFIPRHRTEFLVRSAIEDLRSRGITPAEIRRLVESELSQVRQDDPSEVVPRGAEARSFETSDHD